MQQQMLNVCLGFLSLKYRLWFSSQKCRFCLYVILDFERMAKETRKINKREKKEEKDRRKTIFEDEFALIPDLDFSRSPPIFSTQYLKSLSRIWMSLRVLFFSFTQKPGSGLFFRCRFCLYVCSSRSIQKKSPRLYASPRPGTKNLNVVEVWLRSSRGGQAQAYLQYIFTNTKHSLKVQMALEQTFPNGIPRGAMCVQRVSPSQPTFPSRWLQHH
jgi:hypothetical protein